MHKLLERQLRRTIGNDEAEWTPGLRQFVALVEQAYQSHEADRALIERSLELSSQELSAKNEALARARDDAESANRSKSSFLANMSHEMRTPLNAIIGYSELLIEEAADLEPEEFAPELDKIRAAGRHLLNLINDVLDLSKIEAGRMDVTLEDVDVRRTAADVVTLLSGAARLRQDELTLHCDVNVLSVVADANKLRQALVNLVGNAIKFTEGGQVSIVARRATVADGVAAGLGAWEALDGASPCVAIDVRDTGIGISDEVRPRLFTPFSQADGSTSRRFGGTGLGLSLSRRFLQMMGGDISLVSAPGHGSTFTLWLRESEQAWVGGAAGPSATSVVPADARNTRPVVLAVDDDPAALDLMSRQLSRAGFSVVGRASGADCVEEAVKHRPICILLDVMMPDVDGWRVLAALKRDARTRDIPVVMATMTTDRELGFALGAAEFLTKPLDWERLAGLLHTYELPGRRREILVVDDDPQARELHRRTLSRDGWVVREAVDGNDALARLAETVPSLVVLDLTMPGLDGFGVLERMRGDTRLHDVPVLVVSGRELSAQEHAALRDAVVQVLQKGGYDRDSLVREVERAARAQSSPTPGLDRAVEGSPAPEVPS